MPIFDIFQRLFNFDLNWISERGLRMKKIIGPLLLLANCVCANDYEIKDGDIIKIKLAASDGYIACVRTHGENLAVALSTEKLALNGAASLFKVAVVGGRQLSDGCSMELIPMFAQHGRGVDFVGNKNSKLAAELILKRGKIMSKRVIAVYALSANPRTIFGVNKRTGSRGWEAVEFWSPSLNLNIDGNLFGKSSKIGRPLTLSKSTMNNCKQQGDFYDYAKKRSTLFQFKHQSFDELHKIQELLVQPLFNKILKPDLMNARFEKLISLVDMVFVPLIKEEQRIMTLQLSYLSDSLSGEQCNLEMIKNFLESILHNNNFCMVFEATKSFLAKVENYLSAQAEVKKAEQELQQKLDLVESCQSYAEKIKLMQELFPTITRLNRINLAERMLGQTKKVLACKDSLDVSNLVSFKILVDKILNFKWDFARSSRCERLLARIKERKQDLDFSVSLQKASMASGKDQLKQYKRLFKQFSDFDDDQKMELAQSLETVFENRASELKTVKVLLKETKQKIAV